MYITILLTLLTLRKKGIKYKYKKGFYMRIISGTARGTKLYTLNGDSTRPTLDRVKESIFNIIQKNILDSVLLDLFAGSGAIGLEAASRGAKKVILCDKSKDAINIINKNIEKTHLKEKVEVYNQDYKQCLEKISQNKFDLIYLDPPYEFNMWKELLNKIIEKKLITDETIIIIETDNKERVINELRKTAIEITSQKKYGRAEIIFLKYKLLQDRKG